MPSDYCPKCQADKNLRVTIVIETTKDENGKTKKKLISSYHCEECNSFIKSEDSNVSTFSR